MQRIGKVSQQEELVQRHAADIRSAQRALAEERVILKASVRAELDEERMKVSQERMLLDAERDRLATVATHTIAQYAPGFENSIVAREVITPLDLERTYGLTGGHIFHGELSLDQFFTMRPLLDWARCSNCARATACS